MHKDNIGIAVEFAATALFMEKSQRIFVKGDDGLSVAKRSYAAPRINNVRSRHEREGRESTAQSGSKVCGAE